jgi:hypothetical protein
MKLTITDYIKVCAKKGLKISVSQLRTLIYNKKIRAKKIDRKWFIDEKEALKEKSFFLIEQVIEKHMTRRK